MNESDDLKAFGFERGYNPAANGGVNYRPPKAARRKICNDAAQLCFVARCHRRAFCNLSIIG